MRLVDYLETRPDVDPKRIGIMGISKGGTEAYLAAASTNGWSQPCRSSASRDIAGRSTTTSGSRRVGTFSPPVQAAARDEGVKQVDAAFVRRFYNRVVPGIYGDYDAGSMLALIAPRPVLVINGDSDARTPLPGVQEAVTGARALREDGRGGQAWLGTSSRMRVTCSRPSPSS